VTQQQPEQLRRDIEQTRRELGDTVERLSHKADVKAQMEEKKQEVKVQLGQRKEHVQQQVRERPAPVGAAAVGIVAGLVALWLIKRR
jgi:Protein of unknown function (DUF3618)